jgi:general nucleoside transport system permease protein
VTDVTATGPGESAPPEPTGPPSPAARLAFYQRAGGVITPVMTALLAFLIGGLVVLATGHNPWSTYKGIFNGTGLAWFLHFGSYHIDLPFTDHQVWFWWNTSDANTNAANLQQTLLTMTPLILTGLAVAFAFRCGMFNIGGQGQYLVGQVLAVIIGSRIASVGGPVHIFLGVVCATLGGALWGGIAGFLKATVGAHEVISTIMLNWIAIWTADYLFGNGGPLQSSTQQFNPVSDDIHANAHLPVFWGDPVLQGLHVGLFIALGMLIVYWVILNRTTLGYEVRAVGFNPEAARYGGISVRWNYFLAMAISGAFAGLAGGIDVLGGVTGFHLATADVHASQIGFIGIAVALLGRNTAIGIFFSSLLFAALAVGTSSRQLDPSVFDPKLASNLTLIIQGLVVLFVGADVLILYMWNIRKKVRPKRAERAPMPLAEAGD